MKTQSLIDPPQSCFTNGCLKTIGEIARIFLQTVDLELDISRLFKALSELTCADRMFILKNHWGQHQLEMQLWAEWSMDEIPGKSEGFFSQNISYEESGLFRWMDLLGQGKLVQGHVSALPDCEQKIFEPHNFQALVAVPIHVEWDWWGFLCLGVSTGEGTPLLESVELIQIFANMFGSAMQRAGVENELKLSQERFRTVADFTHAWEYWSDPQGKIIYSSPSYTLLTGFFHEPQPESLHFFIGLIAEEDRGRFIHFIDQRSKSKDMDEIEFRLKNKKGETRWISHVNRPVFDDIGSYLGQRASNRDITLQKVVEMELQHVNSELKMTIEHLEELNKTVTILNEMGEMFQRCFSDEEVFGVIKDYTQKLFPGISASLYLHNESTHHFDQVLTFGGISTSPSLAVEDCWALRMRNPYVSNPKRSRLVCRHFQGEENDQAYLCIPMIFQDQMLGIYSLALGEEEQEGIRSQVISIAERAAATLANLRLVEKLRRQSFLDPLTGLHNRRYMASVLNDVFASVRKNEDRLAVVMIDLDNFKQLNDQYGHQAGDEVLETVGRFINSRIRSTDTACRYGGDEFTLILPGMGLEAAENRTRTLFEEMRLLEFSRDGKVIYQVEASIGIACFPDHGSSYDEIVQAADQALYLAKEKGKNQIVVSPQ